jgi:hypothetical protein
MSFTPAANAIAERSPALFSCRRNIFPTPAPTHREKMAARRRYLSTALLPRQPKRRFGSAAICDRVAVNATVWHFFYISKEKKKCDHI